MLKTKQMINILRPIKSQIDRLSELCHDELTGTELDTLKLAVIKQLRLLAEKFENASRNDVESYSDLKSKITNIIEEFCIINFEKEVVKESNDSTDEIFKSLLEKFEQSLMILEQLQITPIVQNITDCYDYVLEMGKAMEMEDIRNILELGCSVIDILKCLQSYQKSIVSGFLKNQLSLYGSQLCISCIVLVEVIKRQHEIKSPIYLCKKYACDRLCSCLEALKTVLNSSDPLMREESSSKENNFVYRVDLVLDIITDMKQKDQTEQLEDCKDLWLGIEDIFTHAMSIAQVCQPYNFEAISGSCQTIMSDFENLKTQLEANPPDHAMNSLYMNALSDSIYRLERKINISILILVMEIFSNPFHSLRKLIKTCGNSLKERSKVDLNSLIEEFDQASDRCTQIGKFAISCCKNENRVNKIRSCLASFESLEMELIPAIAALYLHPGDKEMRECVKFLTNQWQKEMDKFHGTIDLIIDPSAYCQVVLDDLVEKVRQMTDKLNNLEDITQAQVQDVISRALTLGTQINATVDDIGQENIDQPSKMLIKEFKAAIYEVDAASKKFLTTKAVASEQLRVINRCEILIKVIQRLQAVLSNIISNSLSESSSINKNSTGASFDVLKPRNNSKNNLLTDKFTTLLSNISDVPIDAKSANFIKTPYSVKSYKPQLSIKPPGTETRKEPNTSILIPYIQKGKILRQEFSIMYKTPKKPDVQMNLQSKNLSNIRQHLFSRNSLLEDSNLQTESIDLTNILEKLTRLSNTTSSGQFRGPSAKKNIFPESVMKKFAAEKNSSKLLSNVTKKMTDCRLNIPEVKAEIDIITRL